MFVNAELRGLHYGIIKLESRSFPYGFSYDLRELRMTVVAREERGSKFPGWFDLLERADDLASNPKVENSPIKRRSRDLEQAKVFL